MWDNRLLDIYVLYYLEWHWRRDIFTFHNNFDVHKPPSSPVLHQSTDELWLILSHIYEAFFSLIVNIWEYDCLCASERMTRNKLLIIYFFLGIRSRLCHQEFWQLQKICILYLNYQLIFLQIHFIFWSQWCNNYATVTLIRIDILANISTLSCKMELVEKTHDTGVTRVVFSS